MSEIVKLYLRLIENPYAAKNYREVTRYYKEKGLHDESQGFEQVLKELFEYVEKTDSPTPDA